MEDITKLILSRPFQTRNADEFQDENILELFVDPTSGVAGPFDYCNEIIKGKMGTGKTMYLRANYIYYLSILVPQMIDRSDLTLPLYIKLSDFQNLVEPEKIYNEILIRLIHEIVNTCEKLQSANELVKLHETFQRIPLYYFLVTAFSSSRTAFSFYNIYHGVCIPGNDIQSILISLILFIGLSGIAILFILFFSKREKNDNR